MTDTPRRYARPGEYYATGAAADAARHLLERSSLTQLAPGLLTVVDHPDRPGLFHLETALVSYAPNEKVLLGFLASICHASPPYHSHLHDLPDLTADDLLVLLEAIGIFTGTTPTWHKPSELARSH